MRQGTRAPLSSPPPQELVLPQSASSWVRVLPIFRGRPSVSALGASQKHVRVPAAPAFRAPRQIRHAARMRTRSHARRSSLIELWRGCGRREASYPVSTRPTGVCLLACHVCIEMCAGMCADMCIHVRVHVCRHVCGRIRRHVHRHMYRHVCGH